MTPRTFWRRIAIGLLLLNALWGLHQAGYLWFFGLGAPQVQEPQRMQDQIATDALHIRAPGAAASAQPATSAVSGASVAY